MFDTSTVTGKQPCGPPHLSTTGAHAVGGSICDSRGDGGGNGGTHLQGEVASAASTWRAGWVTPTAQRRFSKVMMGGKAEVQRGYGEGSKENGRGGKVEGGEVGDKKKALRWVSLATASLFIGSRGVGRRGKNGQELSTRLPSTARPLHGKGSVGGRVEREATARTQPPRLEGVRTRGAAPVTSRGGKRRRAQGDGLPAAIVGGSVGGAGHNG